MTNFEKTLQTLELKTNQTQTRYQVDFYHFLMEKTGNAIVNAVAGSGKTTTLVNSTHFIDPMKKVAMVAFNKHIADELQKRGMPSNVMSCTLHSLGLKCIGGKKKVDSYKSANILKTMIDNSYKFGRQVSQTVSLFKNMAFGIDRPMPTYQDFLDLMIKFELDYDNPEQVFELSLRVFDKSITQTNVIDFDDMIYLPLAQKLPIPTFDFVFVDEAQDLNPIQILFAQQMARNGRAIFVGDRHQAIYGFRGADTAAIETISSKFNAVELPLSICWRCPKNIIKAAKNLVPQIEAAPNAIDGEIRSMDKSNWLKNVQGGDYVLSRTTAPLALYAMKLIKNGQKAIVKGKDIGENLIALIKKIRKTRNGDPLIDIKEYGNVEGEKLNGKGREMQKANFEDKIDTLCVLSEDVTNFDQLEQKVANLFSDSISGVVFATVHKAKGLEAENIYIIQPEKMPHPLAKQPWQIQQEMNLKYVAITRALKTLTWVDGA